MNDCTLIGLCGPAGSGKDSAADHLCERYGFVSVAFAAPIKAMLEAMLEHAGLDHALLHERALKEAHHPALGTSPRRLMQTLGTEWGRQMVGEDLWVRMLEHHAGLPDCPVHDRIVITDVRYPNEARWLRRLGGRLIALTRQQAAPVVAHTSEQWLHALDPDTTLANDGPTLAGFHALLDGAVESLGLDTREALPRIY